MVSPPEQMAPNPTQPFPFLSTVIERVSPALSSNDEVVAVVDEKFMNTSFEPSFFSVTEVAEKPKDTAVFEAVAETGVLYWEPWASAE